MNMFQRSILCIAICSTLTVNSLPPLGLFLPYDINIKLKKPGVGNFQLNFLGEKSYNTRGYATDSKEEKTFLVDVLQIYEPTQNVISLYQGYGNNGATLQTITTPFTQLLDSIAGGPGGGVSNITNGIYKPTATLSSGQFSSSVTYSIGQGFYISAFLPVYFARMKDVTWNYNGDNTLFANQKIQQDIINTFTQDAATYFGLNIGSWKRSGLGDLTLLAEWQRDFIQQRPTLKNVQTNIRLGLSFPTSKCYSESMIMPIDFGNEGTFSVPFGGGLTLTLGKILDIGCNGQFWYHVSNEKMRRIKTFPTQTTLLYPIVTKAHKEFSIVQNFNLHANMHSFCNRFNLKGLYQYWRKGKDTVIPISSNFNFDVVNSDLALDEVTRHQFCLFLAYGPRPGDFKRVIPQFELFWKTAFNGMRTALSSTYGGQLSIIF